MRIGNKVRMFCIGSMAVWSALFVSLGCERTEDVVGVEFAGIVGEVEVMVATYEDYEELMHFLLTHNGRRIRLFFDVNPELETGDKIDVTGQVNEQDELHVESFQFVLRQPRSIEVPGQLRPPLKHKVAVLRLKNSDITAAEASETMKTVDDFYRENSNDIDTFTSKVFGPYAVNTSNCSSRYREIKEDALAAFAADGQDENAFNHIAIVIPKDSNCGWGGLGQVGRPGKPAKITWYNNWFSCSVAAHELGHNVGMNHSHAFICGNSIYNHLGEGCTNKEYGHTYDNMGGNACKAHYSAPQKQYQGWLEDCQDVTAGGSGVFNLTPLEGDCGMRSLRIPIPGDDNFYYVEYRKDSAGKYAGANDEDHVLVSVSNDALTKRANMYLLDFAPETSTFKDAWLIVGTNYTLPGNVKIRVLSLGDTARVEVKVSGSGKHKCAGGSVPPTAGDGSIGLPGCDITGDDCPWDPNKVAPGVCGCGTPDIDSDGDGILDCNDTCPNDEEKTEPGQCGCGFPEGSCVEGQGLKGTYFDNKDFTSPALTRVDLGVNFDWGRNSPDDKMGNDTFSVRWTGYIEAEYSEIYTFYTVSDDGIRLWVNDELIIDNWTLHPPEENQGNIALEAGKRYAIQLEYFENGGGAVAKLLWSSPSQAKQVVPSGRLFLDQEDDQCPDDPSKTVPGKCGCGVPENSCDQTNGLTGAYFNNMDFTSPALARVDPVIDFAWGKGSPDDKIDSNTFSARWTGFIEAKYTGTYTFYTVSDDGVRLWVNKELIIANWTNHAPTEDHGTISLVAGKRYPIKLEYFERKGGAVIQLLWSSPRQTKQIIPTDRLFAVTGANDQCPNDPNKTEPGECGCGVPEGACDDCAQTLLPRERLTAGHHICSENGTYKFGLTDDGKLALWSNNGTVWSAGSFGSQSTLFMQADGNLVVYASGQAVWSSRTPGNSGASLTLYDNGVAALEYNGSILWQAGN